MAELNDLYPPSPTSVPAGLTTPSRSYRLRVLIVLASLIVFALLYFGLIAATGYVTFEAIQSVRHSGDRQQSLTLLNNTHAEVSAKVALFNSLTTSFNQDEIDANSFADQLERNVSAPMAVAIQRLDNVKGFSRRDMRAIEEYKQALRLTESGFRDLVAAMRTQDQKLVESYERKMRDSDLLMIFVNSKMSRLANGFGESTDSTLTALGIPAALLFLFLVKGLIKRSKHDRSSLVELSRLDQPDLFAFLDHLCQETKAPRPHRVFASHEVNAAVFFNQSFLSLILPTRKNLLIGLGLVNGLNLSEFKAVLAHEFGHFSQSSMKLGTYVYTSNKIIADIVYRRDWLDALLVGLTRIDLRLSIFVWMFMGVVWVLRKMLEGLFQVINFANSKLSKQMEFHADLVAASVAGSDAPVHALSRSELADRALGLAYGELSVAADHKLYSSDVFHHQSMAAARIMEQATDAPAAELPRGPSSLVFEPGETQVSSMWETHPSNHERELNIKRRFVQGVVDERSPWLLFRNVEALKALVSRRAYLNLPALANQEFDLTDPQVVQEFLDRDRDDTTYPEHYHGLYDGRYLAIDNPTELEQTSQAAFADNRSLGVCCEKLRGVEVQTRMEAFTNRRARLMGMQGKELDPTQAKQMMAQLESELKHDNAWMKMVDEQSYQVHYLLAKELGEPTLNEFRSRYQTQLQLQAWHQQLDQVRANAHWLLMQAVECKELNPVDFARVRKALTHAAETLEAVLSQANAAQLPALTNIEAGQSLGPLLMSEPIEPPFRKEHELDMPRVGRFLSQIDQAIGRLERILTKSLGAILNLQESIEARWLDQTAQKTS